MEYATIISNKQQQHHLGTINGRRYSVATSSQPWEAGNVLCRRRVAAQQVKERETWLGRGPSQQDDCFKSLETTAFEGDATRQRTFLSCLSCPHYINVRIQPISSPHQSATSSRPTQRFIAVVDGFKSLLSMSDVPTILFKSLLFSTNSWYVMVSFSWFHVVFI